ncbi:MAG: trypsin-like peptidase domain-containing protein [Treponema pedis]
MKKFYLNFIISACFLFFCCNTVQQPHSYVDYSNMSSILYQVEYAERLLNKGEISEALVRSRILDLNTKDVKEVAEIKNKSLEKAEEAFFYSIKEKDWNSALKYFRSITASGKRLDDWTEERIFNERSVLWKTKGDTPLLNLDVKNTEHLGKSDMQDMIKGTVTVWVDKGTRIERGLGFADASIGSGFFIDKRGYFITNYHVIQSEVDPKYDGYSKLYIRSPNDPNVKISAKVIGWDPLFDLALVKTEISPEAVFNLGSSKNLNVGSKIYAMGSPAGLDKTLTSGIVSAKYRRLFSMVDVMQIDAAINHGNSGGPIVDEDGFVQGVVFAGLERNEGINFAIPVELLKEVLPELYAGGEVKHSWLGGYGKTEKIDTKTSGVKLGYILPDGPLSVSGVKEGSIITEFNGMPVTSVEEIQAQLLSVAPDTIITVKIKEKDFNGSYIAKELPVLCKARPMSPGSIVLKKDSDWRAVLPILGFYLEFSGRRNSYRVAEVIPGSTADKAGFTVNDYIEFNGKWIDDDDEDIVHIRIYAKKVKAGYVDSFMILSAYLDNPQFF